MRETAIQQIDRLATFIMDEVPGEPSQSQGAVDTAIRIIRTALNLSEGDAREAGSHHHPRRVSDSGEPRSSKSQDR
jgi:hypothetical protein